MEDEQYTIVKNNDGVHVVIQDTRKEVGLGEWNRMTREEAISAAKQLNQLSNTNK